MKKWAIMIGSVFLILGLCFALGNDTRSFQGIMAQDGRETNVEITIKDRRINRLFKKMSGTVRVQEKDAEVLEYHLQGPIYGLGPAEAFSHYCVALFGFFGGDIEGGRLYFDRDFQNIVLTTSNKENQKRKIYMADEEFLKEVGVEEPEEEAVETAEKMAGMGRMRVSAESHIFLPELEEVQKIQLGSIKIDSKDYSLSKLRRLMDELEQAKEADLSEELVEKGDDYFPVSLIYKDGGRDIFFFFERDGKYYLEAPDGRIFKDADFINDYVSIQKAEASEQRDSVLQIDPEQLKLRLELEKKLGTSDERLSFLMTAINHKKARDCSDKEAVDFARNEAIRHRKLYDYMVENGYTVTDEELAPWLEEIKNLFMGQPDFEEIYAPIYRETGMTLEEAILGYRENLRFFGVQQKFYEAMRKNFSEGQDRIGDKVYDTLDEYYRAFTAQEVYDKGEAYDLKELEELLDDAERIYYEQYSGQEQFAE